MSRVDDLFGRYRTAYRSGGDADPRPYLDLLAGVERRELETLIDAYLARAPRRDSNPAAFARLQSDPTAQRIVASVTERLDAQETWSTVLPRARKQAQLRRDELVDRLATDLGVADRREKVARYYHAMEQGTLPARGVSDRVLAVLAQIVNVSVERLRAAGRATTTGPSAGAAVFARAASPRRDVAADAPAQAAPAEERWDDVDELFRGG